MVVGSSIKALRINNNLTQEDLSRLLGVSRQALCMWESDKRGLKAPILRKIAKIFNVQVDDLLNPEKLLNSKKEIKMKKQTQAKSRTKQKPSRVKFQLKAPEARKVVLTGDFINWKPDGILMKKTRNGSWSASVEVSPGRYEYKFIVDDNWWTDPENNQTVSNALGVINSVKEVKA